MQMADKKLTTFNQSIIQSITYIDLNNSHFDIASTQLSVKFATYAMYQ